MLGGRVVGNPNPIAFSNVCKSTPKGPRGPSMALPAVSGMQSHPRGCDGGKGMVWDPVCVPKKGQPDFPNGKFCCFPRWSLWSGEGGGGWHKALVVGSVGLWRRLLASRLWTFCYDKQASVLLQASALPRASPFLGVGIQNVTSAHGVLP